MLPSFDLPAVLHHHKGRRQCGCHCLIFLKFEDTRISQDSNLLNAINNEASAENRNEILRSYDYLLNNKYEVIVNEKTLDRVKNYFR